MGVPSWILIWAIEKRVVKALERPLERWRRYLIPLPLALLLLAHWVRITAHLKFLEERATVAAQFQKVAEVSKADVISGLGIGLVIGMPFILLWHERDRWEKFWAALDIWAGYFIWTLFPFGVLLFSHWIVFRN